MTSKEEIQEFIDSIKPYAPVRRYNIDITKMIDMLERAVKDLEVLEILKPMLELKKGNTWFYLDTKHCFFETQEQIDLVKEWLENE